MGKQAQKTGSTSQTITRTRREKVVAAAQEAGLLQGVRSPIGARIPQPLVDAAREKTGLTSMTEIVEYALAKVALEDDFGGKLVARKGRVPGDMDLEL